MLLSLGSLSGNQLQEHGQPDGSPEYCEQLSTLLARKPGQTTYASEAGSCLMLAAAAEIVCESLCSPLYLGRGVQRLLSLLNSLCTTDVKKRLIRLLAVDGLSLAYGYHVLLHLQ